MKIVTSQRTKDVLDSLYQKIKQEHLDRKNRLYGKLKEKSKFKLKDL